MFQRGKIRGVSGSTLKLIAMLTMLIDHTAVILVSQMAIQQNSGALMQLSIVMRWVGRLAFPLFCFLLVEGMLYTSNRGKYVLRLVIFALVSEIPFNYAFRGRMWAPDYQNVFFTLAIGLLVMIGFHWIALIGQKKQPIVEAGIKWMQWILRLVLLILGMKLANELHTDYSAKGVLTIVVIYMIRGNKEEIQRWISTRFHIYQMPTQSFNYVMAMMAGCIVLMMLNFSEVCALMDVPIVSGYNGKRGWKLKYVFYIFYPVHLLLLYYLSITLGYVV